MVKRYKVDSTQRVGSRLVEDENGGLVTLWDYDALEARLAEAERDAARYAYLKRAQVLTIDWIVGLPNVEWDAEVDKWIAREQWRLAADARGEP